jgi:membrane associated rhomboid family serine protease
MAHPIIEDIKLKIRSGNPITRLIIINISVFLIISVLRILLFFTGNASAFGYVVNSFIENISIPLSLEGFIHKPWTIITYMFTHIDLFHILWNLVTLYWFGQILSDYTSSKKIIPLYLLGGIVGGLVTLLLFATLPVLYPYQGGTMVVLQVLQLL